ncbi:sigma 54-interacting transcriptional regulator [Dehalobacter sp. DCM]|uniref:sigma-54-dependent Fis family transcriptional regulator n=1 Tax=Dehalobacter sp. DCM TaxID=2907827 RepID=UPI0030815664|nr:sigma 54-interacting transcriptional regulator [Dehalobacter sp. DCM]
MATNHNVIMNYDYNPDTWKRISQAKRRFIEENVDPRSNPDIIPEVAESWIRSKNYGVSPYEIKKQEVPDQKEITHILESNALLIQCSVPFIQKFMPFLTISNYVLSLTDNSGFLLYSAGDENDLESLTQFQKKMPYTSAGEEYIGTNGHCLALIHKIPVQVIGPNNYLAIAENFIASAAPIFNQEGEVIGTLGIIQSYADISKSQKIFAHTLGWVTSLAEAITSQLELKIKSVQLEAAYKTLENSLSVAEQGFVTLDRSGLITHMSKKAMDMLGLSEGPHMGQDYARYFGPDPNLRDALLNDTNVHDLELAIGPESQEKKYIISIDKIWNDTKTEKQGSVIYMTQSSRLDKLIGKRGGMKAYYTFSDIRGESRKLQQTKNFAQQIAATNSNVLLIGESGTGKELFAQAIHNVYCPDGPFMAINCASMPRNLIESELFGYEAGAFTGADKKGRPGKFELANGGTLFLDEIGDMPLEIQPVLLRVLEERQMMRIGGTKFIPVNARIIAATNKDLSESIKNRLFREDLYFRLAVFKITIPPLRERDNDAFLLAQYFVEMTCRRIGKKPPAIAADAREVISAYPWPGNARQLENAVVHAVYMCNAENITVNDLPLEITQTDHHQEKTSEILSLTQLEKEAIIRAMNIAKNDTAHAAKLLGIGRTTLYKRFKEYGIEY